MPSFANSLILVLLRSPTLNNAAVARPSFPPHRLFQSHEMQLRACLRNSVGHEASAAAHAVAVNAARNLRKPRAAPIWRRVAKIGSVLGIEGTGPYVLRTAAKLYVGIDYSSLSLPDLSYVLLLKMGIDPVTLQDLPLGGGIEVDRIEV